MNKLAAKGPADLRVSCQRGMALAVNAISHQDGRVEPQPQLWLRPPPGMEARSVAKAPPFLPSSSCLASWDHGHPRPSHRATARATHYLLLMLMVAFVVVEASSTDSAMAEARTTQTKPAPTHKSAIQRVSTAIPVQ